MLDVSLHDLSFAYPDFALRGVSITFARSTHTAIVGPVGCGASTLLKIMAGELRPESGEVRIGARVVNDLKRARRPLLYTAAAINAPGRWSVRHLLVAAARQRSIDREDRQHEVDLAITKWSLGALLDRRIDTLSSTEATRANLARIEILKPAILMADRILEQVNLSERVDLADELYRTLRVLGTTVITAPSSLVELGATDRIVVLEQGRVVQEGIPSEIYGDPRSAAAAAAHWRVSGVVGQSTTTRLQTRFASRPAASSSAGRVLPAPGAAEIKNGPPCHSAKRSRAWRCQARSDVEVLRVKRPGMLRHGTDGPSHRPSSDGRDRTPAVHIACSPYSAWPKRPISGVCGSPAIHISAWLLAVRYWH